MSIAHVFFSDDPTAEPRHGELHIWLGHELPPPGRALRRARTIDEAAGVVAGRPARVRVALADPLPLLRALATSRRAELRAA